MSPTKAALALALLVAPVPAIAQQSPARAALKRNCTHDYMASCSEYPPGGPAVDACFRANARRLTPRCAAAIGAYKREQRMMRRVGDAR